PGIGDKGSVELIKRFGSVEAALDRASEVEKKTYRESLLNNREGVLVSKTLATIDSNGPIELDIYSMQAGETEIEALRVLFTELVFTSLLKELLPVVQVSEAHYTEAGSGDDVKAVLAAVPNGGALAIAIEMQEPSTGENEEEANDEQEGLLPLSTEPAASKQTVQTLAISAGAGKAVTVSLGTAGARDVLFDALADSKLPKAIHDYKSALHIFEQQNISLNGMQHDPMLYSYLL